MEGLSIIGPFGDTALLLGLSVTRVAMALLLVPLFTADLIPAMVRNAMFMAIALLALLLQPSAAPLQLSAGQLAGLFGKEAFIGAAIGFFFAGVMWAFEAAGQVIDNKVGSAQAQLSDPFSGHTTTLTGAFLARLASLVFMSSGGFMILVGTVVESYALWPVRSPMPTLAQAGAQLFEAEFGRIMLMTLVIAAPALILMYLIDGTLGLINRFAPSLNVQSVSMSLKGVAAVWILWMQVTALVEMLQGDLLLRGETAMRTLRLLLGG